MSSYSVKIILILLATFVLQDCKKRKSIDSDIDGVDSSKASLYSAGNRFQNWTEEDRYLGKVQPVLAARCATCHGCTDSPCSAKLTSYAGVMRGASKANPYAVRVNEIAYQGMQINEPGFFEITNSDMNKNLMFKFIVTGQKNTTELDDNKPFDLQSLQEYRSTAKQSNSYECPADLSEFEAFTAKHNMGGMPFGLPKLSESENKELLSWLAETSSAGPSPEALEKLNRPGNLPVIHAWESFLNSNTDAKRMRLVAKYLYEHWFNSHIAFEEIPGEFYQIVRSTVAAPGSSEEYRAVAEMITPLPTDAPTTKNPFFYRFKKIDEVITQKNHVVFTLRNSDIESFKNLFFPADQPWQTTDELRYENGDPFENFKDIPEAIRYRFMLENARYIVDSMVRAPVCIGESATYAIPDHFWAFFLKPESDVSSGAKIKMSKEGFAGLNLSVDATLAVSQVEDRFVRNYKYLDAYEDALRANLKAQGRKGLDLSDIWFGEPLRKDGRDSNPNAWLSITRHDASTTVQFGHEGGTPQHMWLLSYANFERLYYNLVVNFKYWGGIKHKLGTWRSMSHERLDAEDLFISMLPYQDRGRIRMAWSGGLELGEDMSYVGDLLKPIIEAKTGVNLGNTKINRYIDLYPLQSMKMPAPRINAVTLPGQEPSEIELTRMIRDKMKSNKVITTADDLNSRADGENIFFVSKITNPLAVKPGTIKSFATFEKALANVGATRGWRTFAAKLPATVFIRVKESANSHRLYSIAGNRAYKSHNLALLSSKKPGSSTRWEEEDTVSIYRGLVGDHPQLFLDLNLTDDDGSVFFNQLSQINKDNAEQMLAGIKDKFQIKRNSSKFWPFVDALHHDMVTGQTPYGPGYVWTGLLDLSRYDIF